jgi:hypothetical protein
MTPSPPVFGYCAGQTPAGKPLPRQGLDQVSLGDAHSCKHIISLLHFVSPALPIIPQSGHPRSCGWTYCGLLLLCACTLDTRV